MRLNEYRFHLGLWTFAVVLVIAGVVALGRFAAERGVEAMDVMSGSTGELIAKLVRGKEAEAERDIEQRDRRTEGRADFSRLPPTASSPPAAAAAASPLQSNIGVLSYRPMSRVTDPLEQSSPAVPIEEAAVSPEPAPELRPARGTTLQAGLRLPDLQATIGLNAIDALLGCGALLAFDHGGRRFKVSSSGSNLKGEIHYTLLRPSDCADLSDRRIPLVAVPGLDQIRRRLAGELGTATAPALFLLLDKYSHSRLAEAQLGAVQAVRLGAELANPPAGSAAGGLETSGRLTVSGCEPNYHIESVRFGEIHFDLPESAAHEVSNNEGGFLYEQ